MAHSNLSFIGLAKAAMAFFAALRWHQRHSLPALRRGCCQVGLQRSGRCHAGVCQCCACVLLALRWRHHQLSAVVLVAGVAPVSLPSLRGHFCPCRAGIVALVAIALPPALQIGICPVTKQSRHVLVSLPALRHCGCQRSASIVALVAWASSPSLRWHCHL
jgi:hypothetical protein